VQGPGKLQELLPFPPAQSGMLLTERLIPAPQDDPSFKTVSCSIVSFGSNDGISLTGSPCKAPPPNFVDSGPVADFAGAAREDRSAVVRVSVEQQKWFAVGTFEIDDWVGFSIDGGPVVALPAKGIEPVVVTARFLGLTEGPHRISYTAYQGFDTDRISEGVVCL
ncbi:MAG: hypothetical protein WAK16_12065, partial [Candidatus Cybelea sp.]